MWEAALAIAVLLSCTDGERSRRVLEDAGYTNIEITGHDAWGCAKGDTYCTGFTATGPTGRKVSGAVGCGMGCGKGCTIRME